MSQQYMTVITAKGKKLVAEAIQKSEKLKLKFMAVGDGNGSTVIPSSKQDKLINEVYRIELNSLKIDDKNPDWLVAEGLIPPEAGGFYIREIGLFTESGDLFAVANHQEAYKPIGSEGAVADYFIRLIIMVSDAELIITEITSLAGHHPNLTGRDLPKQHPKQAIEGLNEELTDMWSSIKKNKIPTPYGDNGSVLTVVDKKKELLRWQNLSVVKVVQGNVDIYVATTGDDKTGDGSKDKPFKTIQKAVNESYKYVPDNGHNIYIKIATGTYYESIEIDGLRQTGDIFFHPDKDVTISSDEKPNLKLFRNSSLIVTDRLTFQSKNNFSILNGGSLYFSNGLDIFTQTNQIVVLTTNLGRTILDKQCNITYVNNSGKGHSCFFTNDMSFLALKESFEIVINGFINFEYAFFGLGGSSFSYSQGSAHTRAEKVTGRKFGITEGSIFNSYGKGANYFPGTEAGVCQQGSYYF